MNFKTIFVVSVFTLLSVINAAPVGYLEPIDEIYDFQKTSMKYCSGKLLSSLKTPFYICVEHYWPDREFQINNPEKSVCFFANDTPLCINQEYSNVPECIKKNEAYDYETCLRNFINGPLNLALRVRTYPDHKKIVDTPERNEEECTHSPGIFLKGGPNDYICISPEKYYVKNGRDHCITVQLTSTSEVTDYCIIQDNSTISECDQTSELYDRNLCNEKVSEFAKGEIYSVSEYRW